ncbi:dynein light chain 1, cytoplasmic [Brachypodium distachyon]|uniref:Dynein light chain n=1 Tax=Brachypodium distachyon TaxID=15368 RepID=I1IEH3_BRADI|nr:dynein light chain 1, cytoplasmic [Brachypodium distachyon]KQK01587.1 hypothetical protein BRADI_3g56877v3 [Brachypodium distachyon]|eukprot:XP_003573009.1 dynein light chain 1, cytoplasmic [Brachypodium distachyon]
MREQEGACEAGRRGGGVIRSLLGVDSPPAEDVVVVAVAPEEDGGSTKKKKAEAVDGEQRKAVVRVVAADMPAALQRRAFRCARDELASMPHFPRRLEPKRLALALKKEFDTAYGSAWHCIVGTSFGSYVTHARGGFLYFSVDKVHILLFRTAVEPSPH